MTSVLRGRRLALAVSLISLAMTATACGGSDSSGASPGGAAITADPASVSGEITFSTWWAYANDDLVNGFKDKYPDVKVTLDFTPIDSYAQHIQTLGSSGDLPDVFAAQSATLVALQGANQLLDLQDALGTPAYDLDQSWGQTFIPSLLEGANSDFPADAKAGGETYGVPFNAISIASIYNADIFKEVGISPAGTFADLLSNCKALDAAGYIPMSLTGKDWIDWWVRLAWDQTMRDEDPAKFDVSDPNYIKGFEIMKQMADAGCWADSQVSTDIAGEQALFVQGKTAQFVSVPENFLGTVADEATFTLGTAPLPPLDGVQPAHVMGGGNANVLVVNANSKNQAAAVAFAKYLTSAEVEGELAKTQYTIPSIVIPPSTGSQLMQAYVDAAAEGFVVPTEHMPPFSTEGQITLLSDVLPSLVLGKITPQEAAAATADLFEK